MPDPTKVLDALQNLVVQGRAVESVLPLATPSESIENVRVAIAAAEKAVRTRESGRLDHLRRVEARGPGPKTVAVGPYQVELVRHELLDPPGRMRIWRESHLVAEIELEPEGEMLPR